MSPSGSCTSVTSHRNAETRRDDSKEAPRPLTPVQFAMVCAAWGSLESCGRHPGVRSSPDRRMGIHTEQMLDVRVF